MKYKFRIPHKCQNGHFRYLYSELIDNGCKTSIHWGEKAPECNCPTHEIGEGFGAIGPPEMWSGWTDKDETPIYDGDICEIEDDRGEVVEVICEFGVANRVFLTGTACDIAGFYFKKGKFKSFPISNNYRGLHDTKIMKVVGNKHQRTEP